MQDLDSVTFEMEPGLPNGGHDTVLQYDRSIEKWTKIKADVKPKEIRNLPKICFVFLTRDRFIALNSEGPGLISGFGAPRFLAKKPLGELNGYFGARTQPDPIPGGLGKPPAQCGVRECSTWFSVLAKMMRKVAGGEKREDQKEYVKDLSKDYIWLEMGFFTSWKRGTNSEGKEDNILRILCVDTPDDMPERLKELLKEQQEDRSGKALDFADPLALHSVLLNKVILLLDVAVWRVRDRVRDIEKSRGHASMSKRFESMHEVGRHGIHMSEVLEVTTNTIASLLEYQTSLHAKLWPGTKLEYTMQAQEYSRFQMEAVRALRLRSTSNDKRLDKEITLAFNQIAQSDNTVVKSIAILTMFFLPSTFVSSIFSTSFFEFQESGWTVSDKFWIFWAVAIPATLLAPIWMLFAYRKPKKQ